MNKSSIQVTITPLFLETLKTAAKAMEGYNRSKSLNEAAKDGDVIVGQIARQALFDNDAHLQILQHFIRQSIEEFN